MQSYDEKKFGQLDHAHPGRASAGLRLRAIAALVLTLAAAAPTGFAQQAVTTTTDKSASDLPPGTGAHRNAATRSASVAARFFKAVRASAGNPIKMYMPTTVPKASFVNSVRLTDLVKNGKIYLSLSDALALALENNYDIAISRYYMDLADLDLLRAKAGSTLFGSGAVVNTLYAGRLSLDHQRGRRPGRIHRRKRQPVLRD
jgi:outer membrane protein